MTSDGQIFLVTYIKSFIGAGKQCCKTTLTLSFIKLLCH